MTNDEMPTLEFQRSARSPSNRGPSAQTAHSDTAQTPAPDSATRQTPPPLWSSTPSQDYVQVPSQMPGEPPALRKTGPSAPTLVLAGMMIVITVVAAAIAWRFPEPLIPNLWNNPALTASVIFAAFGVILLIIAIAWAAGAGIHALTRRHHTNDDSARPTPDQPTPGTRSK